MLIPSPENYKTHLLFSRQGQALGSMEILAALERSQDLSIRRNLEVRRFGQGMTPPGMARVSRSLLQQPQGWRIMKAGFDS